MTHDKESDMEYENTYCPNLCSIVHPVPNGTHFPVFTCPQLFGTNSTFYWCDACGMWEDYGCEDTHERLGRQWLCDPSEHNYIMCDGYGCTNWIREGYGNSPCYNSDLFCAECWEGCDCSDCNPPDEEDYGDYHGNDCDEGEERNACPMCEGWDDHLDLLTEEFFCKCAVKAILLVDPDHPFRLARTLEAVMA